MKYRYNPSCGCARCRAHGFMGPTVLITIGVLFLLDQVTHTYWLSFGRTWPALLIVIGLVMFMQHNAPATGHTPPEYTAMPPAAPPYPGQQPPGWRPPVVSPPATTPAPNASATDQGEVRHG